MEAHWGCESIRRFHTKAQRVYEATKKTFAPLRETTSTKSELMKQLTLAFIFITVTLTAAHAQNWPQFRGPGATGVIEGPAKAVTLDTSTSLNVRWKTPIPGLSHASPVVWG